MLDHTERECRLVNDTFSLSLYTPEFRNAASSVKSPSMATASSMSLCILASLSMACTAIRKALLQKAHQKILDNNQNKKRMDKIAMMIVAVF
jgi:hypothetical protein